MNNELDIQQIKEYIKENLQISVVKKYDWDDPYLKIELTLEDEVISSDSIGI